MIPIGEDSAGVGSGFIGAIQDTWHANLERGFGGARQVIDHDTFARVGFIGEFLCNRKRFGHGLAIRRDGVDVHDVIEEVIEIQY